ncbi:Uncharacterised protein [Enterobacter cloacae]|nr:Uncharacterised protein [Enterobacter cloacae]SAB28984.1 Uncharacterised protein [Enterobacter hormaechei]
MVAFSRFTIGVIRHLTILNNGHDHSRRISVMKYLCRLLSNLLLGGQLASIDITGGQQSGHGQKQ